MTPKIVNKEEKRMQILQAAVKTFVVNGFEKATIQDVAERAGIGKGTIYEYFNSKEEIVAATCDYFFGFLRMDFILQAADQAPAIDKLQKFFRFFSEFVTPETEPMMRLMFHFWGESFRMLEMENIIMKRLKVFYDEYRGGLADLIRQGIAEGSIRSEIDSRMVAAVLVGSLDAFFLQALLDGDIHLPKRLIETLWDILRSGVMTENVESGGTPVQSQGE